MRGKDLFNNKGFIATIIIVAVILADQIIKVIVKTSMFLHESISITSWFKICFIENNGMAFGMEVGSKYALSILRILLIILLCRYIYFQIRKNARIGYIITLAMIIAGAVGNLIDSAFYGLIFENSTDMHIASIIPFGTGYASFLTGKVVDMFYFPIINTTWPDWIPFFGGSRFIFFSPVFNFADANITVGFALLLIFYRKELSEIRYSNRKKKSP